MKFFPARNHDTAPRTAGNEPGALQAPEGYDPFTDPNLEWKTIRPYPVPAPGVQKAILRVLGQADEEFQPAEPDVEAAEPDQPEIGQSPSPRYDPDSLDYQQLIP